ncbi:MAG: hypothetical protein ROO76_04755 [Terriglobia bacterium]|nr:hypothetical protein [Terriglobia bacterium]
MPNGNIEFDAAAIANGNHGLVQELTNQPHPQLVWRMEITNQNSCRATWLQSLYSGVRW